MNSFRTQKTKSGLRVFFCLPLLALFFGSSLTLSAQGLSKHSFNLYPKKPPIVFPAGANFTVQVYQQGLFDQQHVQKLKDELESDLLRYDWRLKATPSAPDTVISFIVYELTAFSTRDYDYTIEQGTIGTHKETDPSTGATRQVEEVGSVPRYYPITVLEGHLSVRYEAREAATARKLDSDVIKIDFKRGFESRAPGVGDIYDLMIDNLVHMVAARFVPDFYPVTTSLPGGRLKRASFLLYQGMWNSALEEIQAVPEFQNPEDEAYRLYALGLAMEGLGYESPYLVPTINYLKQAAAYYKLGRQRKASETVLRESEDRVLELLNSYKTVETSVRAFEESKRRKDAESWILSKYQSRYKSTDFLDNNDVLGWAQSGAKEKEMLDRLRDEKYAYFDLTPESISALQAAGVTARVIDTMRESMRGRPYRELERRKWLGNNPNSLLSVYPQLIIRKSSD